MTTARQPPTLYLVDGTSQIYRAYFALPRMTNAAGLPTAAVYGFTTMLRKLLKDERPTHAAVAFDVSGAVFRSAAYADYKAHRPPTPDDLQTQLPYARRVCEALRIPVLEQEGFEADDLIATWCARARREGCAVVIVASDKDLLQLVGDGISVLNPSKALRLDAAGVAASFGVGPERVLDVQGLMGDAVDNIPGVPGVGEKTAVGIVGAYGDIEAVIERAARFVEAFDARDALRATLDGGAELPAGSLQRLAAGVAGLLAVERDDSMRERLAAVGALLGGAGERPAAAERKTLKRELKALDRGSARRIWHAIHEHRESARLSKRLATLEPDMPVAGTVEQFRLQGPDRAQSAALFAELGFRSLTAEIERESAAAPAAAPDAAVAPGRGPRETVLSRERLVAVAGALGRAERCAVTVRADGPSPLRAALVGIALSDGHGVQAYVPVGHAYLGAPGQLGIETVREVLAPLLADPRALRAGHDVKSQGHVLDRAGMPVGGWTCDTMLAWFLLDSDRASYPLAALVAEVLGRDVSTLERLTGTGARRRPLRELPVEAVAEQALDEVETLVPLAAALGERLAANGLDELYRTVDGPLLPLLGRMEARGVRVDCALLAGMSDEFDVALGRLRGEIQALAGCELNPDSPKQLREVLFERLGLRSRRKTAKSRLASTDAQALEELAGEHEIARKLLEYRELAKLKGTYVDALPRLADPETGRVHTSFDPTGAATGRLSSSDPNLQNIPVRTEAGRRIRAAFVADAGSLLLSSDYSQIELRVLAHLSGDEGLRAAFAAEEDVHRFTASEIFGVPLDLVTSEMRRAAKVVNFGVLYGMSETRLAREQGLSRADAKRFIEAYFARFSRVRGYIDGVREAALRQGEVRTLFGRVRRFPQLRERVHRGEHEQALRAAVNATIQGTAADLMKAAMLRVDDALARAGLGAQILLQVHDELLLEVPEHELEPTRVHVREAMETVRPLDVPLRVEQKSGRNWRDLTQLPLEPRGGGD